MRALRAGGLTLVAACGTSVGSSAWTPPDTPNEPIGSKRCGWCHEEEHAAWAASDHALAVQPVEVLGDLIESTDLHGAVLAPEGPWTPVATLGHTPVRQVVLKRDDGWMAVPTVGWTDDGTVVDLRTDGPVAEDDPLHWTQIPYRANDGCLPCHTTGFALGRTDDGFETTWDEAGVGCEACHGPARNHMLWAEAVTPDGGPYLERDPGGATEGLWSAPGGERGIAHRLSPPPERDPADTCAPCHSLRADLGGDDDDAFLDAYLPSLLEEGLYTDDGRILEEVFTWGSFQSSKMHAAGVTCLDCHTPHGGGLRDEGDAVCQRCHDATTYGPTHLGPEHAGHTDVACVDCHMPKRTYMQVDPRGDHAFRVPQPRLAEALGIEARGCTDGCHADQTATWAAEALEGWGGGAPRPEDRWWRAIAGVRAGDAGALAGAVTVVEDPDVPDMVRATAIVALIRTGLPWVGRWLADLQAPSSGLEGIARAESPGLVHAPAAVPRAVRVAAATTFASTGNRADDTEAMKTWYREAIAALDTTRDHTATRLTLALLHERIGEIEAARAHLEAAVAASPSNGQARVLHANFVREHGGETPALALYEAAYADLPDDPAVATSWAFALVRTGDKTRARDVVLRTAASNPTPSSDFAALHAVVLQEVPPFDARSARRVLEEALERSPLDLGLMGFLETRLRFDGDTEAADAWAARQALLSQPPR